MNKLKAFTKRVRDKDEAAVAVVADVIGSVLPYGGNVIAFALKKGLAIARNRSAAILSEELPAKEPTPEQVEQFAPMVAMHARMAMEGEADGSLRLLARIIAGQLEQGELLPAEFASYARILSGMRQVEIVALGEFYRCWQDAEKEAAQVPDLDERGNAVELGANKAMAERLIPGVVADYRELKALFSSLTRTGLLITTPTASGGDRYRPSSLFHRLSQLASLEVAAAENPSDPA